MVVGGFLIQADLTLIVVPVSSEFDSITVLRTSLFLSAQVT